MEDSKSDNTFPCVDSPTIFLDGEHFSAFGHFFGEVLSRLWIADHIDIGELKVVTNRSRMTRVAWDLLALVGVRPSNVIALDRPTTFKSLLIPSQSHIVRKGISPIGRRFYEGLADRHGAGICAESVYISRRLQTSRRMVNEPEVENLFKSFGFNVFYPEQLTIRAQLSLFRNVRYLAGPSGSNMFGTIVSREAQKEFLLTNSSYILHNDSVFNAGRSCEMTVFVAESTSTFDDWRVNFERLRGSVQQWIAQLS